MIPFLWRMAWRYFTGLHMDGKLRCNGSGSVLPRYSSYFWNRYTRRRRALIRQLVFWLILAVGFGLIDNRQLTVYALLATTPFLLFQIARKVIDALTQVTSFIDGDGVKENYRVVRPKVRRWITDHRPTKWRVNLPDGGPVPPEIARAIMAENAEDNGEPIIGMRLPTQLTGGNNDRKLPAKNGRNPYRRVS